MFLASTCVPTPWDQRWRGLAYSRRSPSVNSRSSPPLTPQGPPGGSSETCQGEGRWELGGPQPQVSPQVGAKPCLREAQETDWGPGRIS